MLIVLEGTDGAGKTTLACALVEALRRRCSDDVELVKSGPPTCHPLLEYERPLWDYRPGTGRHLVLDRWHLGELVYPGVVGRRTQFDRVMSAHVDLLLMSRGALLVWVTAASQVIMTRVARRGDDFVTPAQAVTAAGLFSDVVQRSAVDLCRVDTSPSAEPVDPLDLLATARRLENEAERLNSFTTYVGPATPRLLLLGDVRGVAGALASGPASAFVPYRGTSGHYLLDALGADACHSYRGALGLANACDVDDPGKLLDVLLWRAGDRLLPEVVALGRRAHDALSAANVLHRSVDHPQYVRRFHHRERDAYRRHVLYGTTPPWRNRR